MHYCATNRIVRELEACRGRNRMYYTPNDGGLMIKKLLKYSSVSPSHSFTHSPFLCRSPTLSNRWSKIFVGINIKGFALLTWDKWSIRLQSATNPMIPQFYQSSFTINNNKHPTNNNNNSKLLHNTLSNYTSLFLPLSLSGCMMGVS